MTYQIKNISATKLNQFYNQFTGEKSFLQNAKYGEFREKNGEQIFRKGIFKDKTLIAIAQIQKIKTRLKTFLHIPHGPLILTTTKQKNSLIKKNTIIDKTLLKFFLSEYVKLGEREKCDLVRLSPLFPKNFEYFFQKNGFRPATIHLVNPEKTWVLNIEADEEEILKNMKKSTRYEIRRGLKCNIKVIQGNSDKDLDIFWELHTETVKRQGFVPFSKSSTKKEIETYGEDCLIFSGKIDNKFLSSSLILFDKHSAYYHQGASIYSKMPVSHATLWAAILEAKRRGCKEFNFWGVCEKNDKKHPWFGLSKFKRGFGGEERNYMHVHDYPLTWKYILNISVEKWRKWQRGY